MVYYVTNITIGNIKNQQLAKRGWLVGQFMDPPFKDHDVEICVKVFPVGIPNDQLHTHPVGREYILVIKGRASLKAGADILEIKEGDYLTIPNTIPDQLVQIHEELTLVVVRTPSIPNNKVYLEK